MSEPVTFEGRETLQSAEASFPWQRREHDLPSQPLPWQPGRMPELFYQGIWAHYLIGLFYRANNVGHRVLLDLNVSRISLIANGIEPPSFGARLRPDILDMSLLQLWEIKPAASILKASFQMDVYRNMLGPTMSLTPGTPRQGTEGKVFAPGGYIGFEARLPGVIRYSYMRNR
jgi:hypothetical protein